MTAPEPQPAPGPTDPGPVQAQAAPAPSAIPATLPHNLSPWAMFIKADIVVKAVMVGLAFASLVTWTVWLAKSLQLVGARFRAVRAVRALFKAESLADLDSPTERGPLKGGPVAALVHAAVHERARSADLPADGIKERAAIALQRVEARAARAMTPGHGPSSPPSAPRHRSSASSAPSGAS